MVQELQTQLADKMRGMDDFEDELERKDRTIYYLERDMNFRLRTKPWSHQTEKFES